MLYALEKTHRASALDFDISLTTEHTGEFDQGSVLIEILGPRPVLAGKGPGSADLKGRPITTNSISAVIRLSRNGDPLALLTGDIDEVGLLNLIEDERDLRCFLMVFPHHGGRPGDGEPASFAERLSRLASPSVVVFSIGRNKTNGPRPEIVEAVRKTSASVRIACTQLSKHCAVTLPTSAEPHFSTKHGEGKMRGCSCAGTILLVHDDGPSVAAPDANTHEDFIRRYAPNALCRRAIV